MRKMLILLPIALIAVPASAETPPPSSLLLAPPAAIQDVLADPATADKIAGAMDGLSKALLNLPVGEIEAAVDGRPATAADKRRTVRDVERQRDPNFERNLDRQIADSRVAVRSGMQAMASALPAMTKAMNDMSQALERALANMPSPAYPRR
jgi:hypothetical protein